MRPAFLKLYRRIVGFLMCNSGKIWPMLLYGREREIMNCDKTGVIGWTSQFLRTMVYEFDMTHYWFIDICISQSPSSSCSLRFFFSLNFQKRDMIFYFTRRSFRKSSRFFPTRSVKGSDNSLWAGSKEPGIVSPRPRSSFSSFDDAWVMMRGLGSWLFYPPLLCVLERLAVAVK